MIQQVLTTLGFIILGFLIAEFQNAFLGKQEKTSKIYFSILGVSFTQNDIQRLLFAISIGIGIMFLFPEIVEMTGFDIQPNIVYLITGYSPSTVMMFVKKKVRSGEQKEKK